MKYNIKERIEKMQDEGLIIITPEGVEKAVKDGWVKKKDEAALQEKADDAMVKHLDRISEVAVTKGIIEAKPELKTVAKK